MASLSSLSQNWEYDVFPSFHGKDVRQNFLSHVLKEFSRKGINFFIDNEIKRGEFIGPVLKRAIRESKIAVVLLSKNYASSSWCLDELVEIMKKQSGQKLIIIFYEVDPTDVKKQMGDFGKVFKKTCKGKDKEKVQTWRKALEGVATIAGYHSSNWDDETTMIENIAADISNELNLLTPSHDFDHLIGMGAHMERMGVFFLRVQLLNIIFYFYLFVQMLPNLKRMVLSYSRNLKELPNLSMATSLKELDLCGCSSLVKLSSSIGNATNLHRLDLRKCSSLLELPSFIGNLTNHYELDLSGCSSLVELPSSIGNLTNLKKIDLSICSCLVELPSSIGNLTKLRKLILCECFQIP